MASTLFDKLYINRYQYTEYEQYIFDKRSKNKRERYKNPLLDVPVIIWDESYEDAEGSGRRKFLKLIQNVSDYLLFNGNTVYDDNQNQPKLYDAMRGIIDPKDYEASEYIFGDKGSSPIRDNHFFYTAKESTIGQAISIPFKFSSKNISNEYTKSIIKKQADIASEYLIDLALQGAANNGVPQFSDFVTGIANQSMTEKDLIEVLNAQEYMEKIITDLLLDIKNRSLFHDLTKKSWEDKFAINSQFAHIDVINGDVIPKHLDPGAVSWISDKKIETLEDPSVLAVGLANHLSLTEILNNHGSKMSFREGSKGLLRVIKEIIDQKEVQYDPGILNFVDNPNTVTYNLAEGKTSDLRSFDYLSNMTKINWSKDIFYPRHKTSMGLGMSILEHKIYFNILKNERFAVEINGKKATESLMQKWRESDYDRNLVASFTKLEKGEKIDGRHIVYRPVKKLFEATRLGHNTIIDIGEYKYDLPEKRQNNFPVIAQISRDKSFTLIGFNYAYWSNIIFNRIEEIINQLGLSNILLIDENQMTGHGSEVDFLYNAKKSGIGLFNSSRVNNSNQNMAARHLSVTTLGAQAQEAESLLSTVGLMKRLYDQQVGSSNDTLGITEQYKGKAVTQMAIQNQGALKANKFSEHFQFMNQVLQRTGDVLKIENSYDGTKTVLVNKNEKKFLKLSKDIGLWDYNIYLENGSETQKKKDVIDQMAMQMAPSGGVDFIEPLIDILLSDNAADAREILRNSKNYLVELQAKKAEKDREALIEKAKIDNQTASIPMDIAILKARTEIQLQKMQDDSLKRRDNEKGLKDDITEQNRRDQMLLQNELEKDKMELEPNPMAEQA